MIRILLFSDRTELCAVSCFKSASRNLMSFAPRRSIVAVAKPEKQFADCPSICLLHELMAGRTIPIRSIRHQKNWRRALFFRFTA